MTVIVTLADLIRFAIHWHVNFWPLDWLVSLFEWFLWWLLGSMWNVHQLNFLRFFTLDWSFLFGRHSFLNCLLFVFLFLRFKLVFFDALFRPFFHFFRNSWLFYWLFFFHRLFWYVFFIWILESMQWLLSLRFLDRRHSALRFLWGFWL